MPGFFDHIAQAASTARFCFVAAVAIVVYDHLITLEKEVELIWNRPWSIGKVLFILNRYYILFSAAFNLYALFGANLTNDFCHLWSRWQGWTGLGLCMLSEIILQLRIYALYRRSTKVLIFLAVSFTLVVSVSATIMATELARSTALANFVPGTLICVPLGNSHHFYAFWIPFLAFETTLFLMALWRGYLSYQNHSVAPFSGQRILDILVRDSILYFLVMFATYVTITSVWIVGNQDVVETPVGFVYAMECVMGNRLLLNLRECRRENETAELPLIATSSQEAVTVLQHTNVSTPSKYDYLGMGDDGESTTEILRDYQMAQQRLRVL